MKNITLSKEIWLKYFLFSVLWLFFFQLVAEFVEAIYAFGLMGTGIPTEIAFVGYFLLPFLFILKKKSFTHLSQLLIGEAIVIIRIIVPLLSTRGRLIVAGLGVFLFLIFMPSLFFNRKGDECRRIHLSSIGMSLVTAVLLSVLFRVQGGGYDLTLFSNTRPIGWLLAALAAVMLFVNYTGHTEHETAEDTIFALSFAKTVTLSVALMGNLLLMLFAFTAPYVMARWTGEHHERIVMAEALVFVCVNPRTETLVD